MTGLGKAFQTVDLGRRAVLVGAFATSAVATTACAARQAKLGLGKTPDRQPDLPPQGVGILSQSVMLSAADPAGRNFIAIRACQYPEAATTWLWASVLTRDGFYQFAANNLTWNGPQLMHESEARGDYVARGNGRGLRANARFQREGKLGAPKLARLKAQFDSDPALQASSGQVSVEADFIPQSGYAGLLPGRTEAFGTARVALKINGRHLRFYGPAQFHEQSQTDARFVHPFAFASLWSPVLCATLLDSPPHSGAYVIDAGVPRGLQRPVATFAADHCSFDFVDAGNPAVARFEIVKSYFVPLYGMRWQGRFVRGEMLGRRVVGMLNSWARL